MIILNAPTHHVGYAGRISRRHKPHRKSEAAAKQLAGDGV